MNFPLVPPFKLGQTVKLNNPSLAGNALNNALVKIVGMDLKHGNFIVQFIDPDTFVDGSAILESFDQIRVFVIEEVYLERIHEA